MKTRHALWPLTVAFLSLAQAFSPTLAQGADPGRDRSLVAHWRNTRIVFEKPRDEHMVLRDGGSAEKWTVTAASRSGVVKGTWSSEGKTLTIVWEDGDQWSRPFTFYQGQLVFPNVPNQRKFWDHIN